MESDIEKYPHVAEVLRTFWGTGGFEDYITGLLVMDRDTAREGFSKQAFTDLIMLQHVHHLRFPQYAPVHVPGFL